MLPYAVNLGLIDSVNDVLLDADSQLLLQDSFPTGVVDGATPVEVTSSPPADSAKLVEQLLSPQQASAKSDERVVSPQSVPPARSPQPAVAARTSPTTHQSPSFDSSEGRQSHIMQLSELRRRIELELEGLSVAGTLLSSSWRSSESSQPVRLYEAAGNSYQEIVSQVYVHSEAAQSERGSAAATELPSSRSPGAQPIGIPATAVPALTSPSSHSPASGPEAASNSDARQHWPPVSALVPTLAQLAHSPVVFDEVSFFPQLQQLAPPVAVAPASQRLPTPDAKAPPCPASPTQVRAIVFIRLCIFCECYAHFKCVCVRAQLGRMIRRCRPCFTRPAPQSRIKVVIYFIYFLAAAGSSCFAALVPNACAFCTTWHGGQ